MEAERASYRPPKPSKTWDVTLSISPDEVNPRPWRVNHGHVQSFENSYATHNNKIVHEVEVAGRKGKKQHEGRSYKRGHTLEAQV